MALQNILKKYTYYSANQVPQIERLRSGVFVFDIVTGGGIPLGRFIEFHGDKSTGKSTMSLKLINNFLERFDDKVALYIDFEHAYDPVWAGHFIKHPDRMYVIEPDYGELGIDFIIKASQEPEVGFIVIDSIATIVPTAETEKDSFSHTIGLQARLVNSMFRRLLPITHHAKREGRPLTVLLINQIRVNINSYGQGTPITKPAGKMQDAVVSMDIRFYTKEYKKVNDVPVRVVHQCNVEKNKVGGHPKRSCQFEMVIVEHDGYKIGEVINIPSMVKVAKKAGLLVREGNKWIFNEKHQFRNLAEVEEFLATPDVYQKVYDYLIDLVSEKPQILIKED